MAEINSLTNLTSPTGTESIPVQEAGGTLKRILVSWFASGDGTGVANSANQTIWRTISSGDSFLLSVSGFPGSNIFWVSQACTNIPRSAGVDWIYMIFGNDTANVGHKIIIANPRNGTPELWVRTWYDGHAGSWLQLIDADGVALTAKSLRWKTVASGDDFVAAIATQVDSNVFWVSQTCTQLPRAAGVDWLYTVVGNYTSNTGHKIILANPRNNTAELWTRTWYDGNAGNWAQLRDVSGNPVFPSVATTASAANAYIGANGTTILKSTSSRRYKANILPLSDSAIIDSMKPITYTSDPDTVPTDDPDLLHYGFIAEDLAEIDPKLVQYTEDAEGNLIPDGVQYDRITVLLVKRIQELEARLKKAGI